MSMVIKRFGAIALLVACNGGSNPPGEEPAKPAVQHNVTAAGVVDTPRDVSAIDGAAAATDLSAYHFGRADVQRAERDTHVALDLAGLASWRDGDSLQIVAPNAGLVIGGAEAELAQVPSAGSTTIRGQAVNWKTAFAPLVDASKGDTTWVTQLVAAAVKPGDGLPYSALARAGIANGLTVRDGQPAALTATLATVAQDRALDLHWKGSQFAALAANAGPGAAPGAAAQVRISALPTSLAQHNDFFASHYLGLPDLVEFGPVPATRDVDQAVSYGDPFASSAQAWQELVTVTYTVSVPVPTPLGTGAQTARFVSATPVDALGKSAELAPAIGSVRDAQINGASLASAQTGVGTTPTIQWAAPALGTATAYEIAVHLVDATALGVSVHPVATFRSHGTSFQIPAGTLTAGSHYVLTLTAIAAPGADLVAQPFVGSLPFASADYVTAQIAP